MLNKEPKPAYKRFLNIGLKGIFVAEAVAFAVSYGVWYKLNTSRETRLYMYKNCNWVLETYYTIGEKVSDIKTRELDFKVWKQENQI